MAGDWIKMRCQLHNDPKIIAVVSLLKQLPSIDESFSQNVTLVTRDMFVTALAVECVRRIWGVVSEVGKRDGECDIRVTHATLKTLDTICGVEGFGDCMARIQWVIEDVNGLIFRNYLQDNSSAEERKRSSDADRQRRKRERDKGVTAAVTENVTVTHREEKRRVDKNTIPRARDEVWDEVAKIWFAGDVKKPDAARVGKLVRDIKAHGGTAKDVNQRIQRYKKEWPDAECTPEAVVKHWARFSNDTINGKPSRSAEEIAAAKEANDRRMEDAFNQNPTVAALAAANFALKNVNSGRQNRAVVQRAKVELNRLEES